MGSCREAYDRLSSQLHVALREVGVQSCKETSRNLSTGRPAASEAAGVSKPADLGETALPPSPLDQHALLSAKS